MQYFYIIDDLLFDIKYDLFPLVLEPPDSFKEPQTSFPGTGLNRKMKKQSEKVKL